MEMQPGTNFPMHMKNGTCRICGVEGHFSSVCPKRTF